MSTQDPHKLPPTPKGVNLGYSVFISNKYQLIYFATEKAGCSTIKHTLMQGELGRTDVRFPSMDQVHDRGFHPLSAPARQYDFAANLHDPAYLKFCFVRDPYARLLSLYLDKIVRRQDGYFRGHILAKLEQESGYTPSFAEFLALVERIGPDHFDGHTVRQATRVWLDVVPYDAIGRFETFEADLRRILTLRAFDFDRYYYAERRHSSAAEARLAEFYDTGTAALVRSIYASDFDAFGYTPYPEWLQVLSND